ncbi:hypothetical protein N7533_000705 [Penicillium manginii]|uniref:uncharacterized protein n=1 Tax=Penicillium manginii TaxID=203109 RepID=UPI0025468F03|nr:uncharacterized protein N7533_000705 [Penicillium manginii]KAJ5768122.1 hypothetical protein N7533_000705 [Penicillium manginii]
MSQGITKLVTSDITTEIKISVSTAILYSATDNNPTDFGSVANGTRLLKKSLTDYAKACPGSKVAAFGQLQ